jgi:hypothetical protein
MQVLTIEAPIEHGQCIAGREDGYRQNSPSHMLRGRDRAESARKK